MNSRRNLILGALALVVLTFLITAGGAVYLFNQVVPDTGGAVKLMRAVDVVRSRYIEPVPLETLIEWQAQWILDGGRALGKPTHFEERKGSY